MSTPQSSEAMVHDYQDDSQDSYDSYQDASEDGYDDDAAETPAQSDASEDGYDDHDGDAVETPAQAHAESTPELPSQDFCSNIEKSTPGSQDYDFVSTRCKTRRSQIYDDNLFHDLSLDSCHKSDFIDFFECRQDMFNIIAPSSDLRNSDDEPSARVGFQVPFYDFLQVQTANVSAASNLNYDDQQQQSTLDPSPVTGDNGSDRNALLDILMDPTAEARDLPLPLFRDITGKFSDEHIIGRGGFGVVYKGMLQNGQMVAVKRLQAYMVDDTRFHTEVNFMKKLNHKNIVRFLAYCVHTEKVEYIKDNGEKTEAEIRERLLCFEYVPHGTIKEHITDESFRLEWPKRYQIIKGICDGLDYIHNVGEIIHLDIKPDNILLDDNIVPKIADFGLSRLVADYSKRTTKNKPGTLGYVAPEYILNGNISRKVDIFGLGRIIVELVTGSKEPLESRKTNNFQQKVLTRWSEVLSTSHSGDSFKLAINQVQACINIALKCTDHDPDKRLDISQILIDLVQVGDDTAEDMDIV